jgi:hypothetical protein
MKQNVMLTSASVLSVLFFSFHLADDIVRGIEPGTLTNLTAVPIFVLWLYGTLVLAERRSGYIITLLGGLFALVVPIAHMRGKGVGVASSIANSSGGFFFVWTLIAIGVTGLFSVILSTRGLWSLPWRRPRQCEQPEPGKASHGGGKRLSTYGRLLSQI